MDRDITEWSLLCVEMSLLARDLDSVLAPR
jgi:hypothetical protein